MTMTNGAMDRLAARGLDVELLDRLGFDSAQRVAGDPGRKVEALVIPFRRNGRVVRRKYKLWEIPEGAGAYQQDKGGVRCVWNEDALRDPRLAGKPWILTEGELDAVAAIQSGYERTSSVPDGAPMEPVKEDIHEAKKYAWVHDLKALLSKENVPEIILATDGDEPGAALLQDLSVLLGRYRCKFLTYPKAPESERERLGRERCKDLNEVLQFYGQKGVVETISRAEFLRVEGVFRMSELPPRPTPPQFEIGFPAYGEHFKLRLGDWSVFTGIPSHGKSTFLTDMLCRVAYRHKIRIAWASFEQNPQTDHRRYLRTWFIGQKRSEVPKRPLTDDELIIEAGRPPGPAGWSNDEIREADAWIDEFHRFIVPAEDEEVTLDWLLERAEGAVAQHDVKVIVADPWNEMDHEYDARSMTEAQYINRSIKTVRRFARAFMVHFCIVAHPTKLPRNADGTYPMPGLYDINGGAVWHNKADLGVVIYREKDGRTRVKTSKSRYHETIGTPGSVLMQFVAENRHYSEVSSGSDMLNPDAKPGRAA